MSKATNSGQRGRIGALVHLGKRPVNQRLTDGSVFSPRAALAERLLCQAVLQSRAGAPLRDLTPVSLCQANAHPTLASV